ncbi:MAG TPA: hypothetical protein VJ797_15685 [Burkholderiales bacterium]|nr:hypothetical protein [Burkholderiales bacterium]
MAADSNDALALAISRLADVHAEQLGAIATAIDRLATQVKFLGNGDTISPMGAIEFLGTTVQELAEAVSGQRAGDDAG